MGPTHGNPGVPVVHLEGEIDLAAAPGARQQIEDLMLQGASTIVVDLTSVTFLDSVALGVLVGALQRCQEAGGTLHLVANDQRVIRVLEITGLTGVFPIHDHWNGLGDAGEEQTAP